MNIEQIFSRPVTTVEHPDPTETRRYIRDDDGFYGYDYVYVEDATWNALCHIAGERGCTVDELCCHIDLNFAPGELFAPAARAYVLHYITEHIPEDSELPTALQSRHRIRPILRLNRRLHHSLSRSGHDRP
jgi:predicted DNA-binding ribbon-helix-helix protein